MDNQPPASDFQTAADAEIARLRGDTPATEDQPIETANDQLVGIEGGQTVIVIAPRLRMTKAEALRHAAWLVAIADDSDSGRDQFDAVLQAVQNT